MEPSADEAVEFDAATRRLHRRLSATAERFLDYVEQNPQAAERSSFEGLDRDKRGSITRLQSWPLFIDRRQQERCSEAMLGLSAVVRATPHRVFGDDAEALGRWYGLEPGTARVVTRLLADPGQLAPIIARGDFVETEDGFGCVEINVAGNIGGWTLGLWERNYLRVPAIRDFVRTQEVDLVGVDPMASFFGHVRGLAATAGVDPDGEINVALAVPPETAGSGALLKVGVEGYRSYLESCGGSGELLACSYDDLEVVGGRSIHLDGRRIHVVVESYSGIVPRRLVEPWMAGGAVLLNGPVGRVLNDRRTLALVSEHAESDRFSEAEREVVRRHLPWTRVVGDHEVSYEGRRGRLPDVLDEERPAMVLKRSASLGGEKVLMGATTEPDVWSRRVAEAVAEGTWIAQKRLHSLPYAFQHGARGWLPHEVVWGIFAFGERYGGGFLRVLPRGRSGIVNASRGADDGLFLVVDEL